VELSPKCVSLAQIEADADADYFVLRSMRGSYVSGVGSRRDPCFLSCNARARARTGQHASRV
jgi:hypothetical protein